LVPALSIYICLANRILVAASRAKRKGVVMPVADKIAIEGIDCMCYLVKDADRAKKFWGETMGLIMTQEYPSGAGGEFTFEDGTTFEIYKMSDGTWHPGSGLMFQVPDIKAAVAYFKGRGVEFEDGGEVMDSPVCSMAFAKDSEGNNFMLHQRHSG